MEIKDFIEKHEIIIAPFSSINAIKHILLEKEYLVLKENNQFIGILTIKDVVKNDHQLAIDCYTIKPFIKEDTSIVDAFRLFDSSNHSILPVIDESGTYIGSARLKHILQEVCYSMRGYVNIQINDIQGDHSTEKAKQQFVSDMLHNMKNPIQTILSSVSILMEDPSNKDIRLLLNAALSSARQIDLIFTKLLFKYFENF